MSSVTANSVLPIAFVSHADWQEESCLTGTVRENEVGTVLSREWVTLVCLRSIKVAVEWGGVRERRSNTPCPDGGFVW